MIVCDTCMGFSADRGLGTVEGERSEEANGAEASPRRQPLQGTILTQLTILTSSLFL